MNSTKVGKDTGAASDQMMKGSTGLRLYVVKGCPTTTIAMTATAIDSEIRDVVSSLGLKMKPVTHHQFRITSSYVLSDALPTTMALMVLPLGLIC